MKNHGKDTHLGSAADSTKILIPLSRDIKDGHKGGAYQAGSDLSITLSFPVFYQLPLPLLCKAL